MQVYNYEVNKENGEDLVIAPLGDIQFTGREEHIAGKRLDAHIQRCLALDALFLGTGDYIDFASPSNRKKLSNADLYDNTTMVLEDAVSHLTDLLFEAHLWPTADRWLGLVQGHHFGMVEPVYTSDEYLAFQHLHCPFLHSCALVRVLVRGPNGRHGAVRLWVHHGEGSGDPIAKLQKIAAHFEADYYIMGHTTQRGIKPCAYVSDGIDGWGTPTLKDRIYWLISTGGWLRAYAEWNSDYAEKAMYAPAALGSPILTIKCCWTKNRVWVPEFRAEG